MNKRFKYIAVPALSLFAFSAFAEPTTVAIDVSSAVDQLGEIGTAVAAVGAALMIAAAIAVAIKWAKASIFG